MIAILVVTVILAVVLGSARFSFKALRSRSTAHGDGPVTLEELFAARYARGEIDLLQYRTSAGHVAAQLRT